MKNIFPMTGILESRGISKAEIPVIDCVPPMKDLKKVPARPTPNICMPIPAMP